MSNVCTHGLSLDEPCVRCELQKPTLQGKIQQVEAMIEAGLVSASDFGNLVWAEMDKGHENVVAIGIVRERLRCRAIILKHLSNDWTANKVLEEIDNA